MSQIVESIVSEIADQQNAEKQQRAQKYQELLGEVRIQLQGVLDQIPGLYESLKPLIAEEYDLITNNNGREQAVFLKWTIQSDDLQLAPVVFQIRKPAGGYYHRQIGVCEYEYSFSDLREAIAQARGLFVGWKMEEDSKFTSTRIHKLNFWGQRDPQVMQKAYDEMVARFPERKPEFDERREEWLREKAGDEEKQAEKQMHSAEVEKVGEEYLAQMISYYQLQREIKERNANKFEALQDALNQPFDAWQLTYALVSYSDGEGYVETSNVWVKAENPDANGYWTTFRDEEIKLFYPVSIEKLQVLPSDEIPSLHKSIQRPEYDFSVVAQPTIDLKAVDQKIAEMGFEALPEKPAHPNILSWHNADDIQKEAYRTVYGPQVEINF